MKLILAAVLLLPSMARAADDWSAAAVSRSAELLSTPHPSVCRDMQSVENLLVHRAVEDLEGRFAAIARARRVAVRGPIRASGRVVARQGLRARVDFTVEAHDRFGREFSGTTAGRLDLRPVQGGCSATLYRAVLPVFERRPGPDRELDAVRAIQLEMTRWNRR